MYNNEIEWYLTPYGNDNPNMANFENWGHYSQIVWTSTTNVGCTTQYCPDGLANTGSGVSPYLRSVVKVLQVGLPLQSFSQSLT
jgi:hypothetical protein